MDKSGSATRQKALAITRRHDVWNIRRDWRRPGGRTMVETTLKN